MPAFRRILLAYDGSPSAEKALLKAADLARDSAAQLRIVHVLDELSHVTGFESSMDVAALAEEGAARVLDEGKRKAREAGIDAEIRLVHVPGKRLADCVAEEAMHWIADLIVVGTEGRRGVGRLLLGSGAEQIVRLAPVAVLVVRDTESH